MQLEILIACIGAAQAIAIAVIGGMFAKGNRKRAKKEAQQDKHREIMLKESQMSMRLVSCTMKLAVQTAQALKTGNFNGQLEDALKEAAEAQKEYSAFINKLAAIEIKR